MPRAKVATPVIEGPEHTVMQESDDSLLAAAQSIFVETAEGDEPEPHLRSVPPIEDEYVPLLAGLPESTEASERAEITAGTDKRERAPRRASTEASERAEMATSTEAPERPDFGKPDIGDMITVKGGGLYLPVRRRVVWMRGEPVPHPDWTIDTIAEKVDEGEFKPGASGKSGDRVEGGYARYRANVFNEHGRLLATGTKTEFSERFLDFVEKAETGAIGRALAVAGYGTEAAVDLDEGLEKERIADAPVTAPGRSIHISSSAVPGVRVGGRPAQITDSQRAEVARLTRALGLGMGLIPLMEAIKGESMSVVEGAEMNTEMNNFLQSFTFEQGGDLVQQLNQALKNRQESAET